MADTAADGKAEKMEKAANGSAGCDAAAAGQGKKRADQAVAFHELFSFADRWDLALMALGTLGALAHGAAMPCFFLLFGDLINGFGKNQTDLRTMTDEVAKVCTSTAFPTPLLLFDVLSDLFSDHSSRKGHQCSFTTDWFSSLLHCSMRSTSSTSDWWSASPPTQVSSSCPSGTLPTSPQNPQSRPLSSFPPALKGSLRA